MPLNIHKNYEKHEKKLCILQTRYYKSSIFALNIYMYYFIS